MKAKLPSYFKTSLELGTIQLEASALTADDELTFKCLRSGPGHQQFINSIKKSAHELCSKCKYTRIPIISTWPHPAYFLRN